MSGTNLSQADQMPSTLKPKDCGCPCHHGVLVVHPVPCCAAVGLWKFPKRKEAVPPKQNGPEKKAD
jgi:hypothetical protein